MGKYTMLLFLRRGMWVLTPNPNPFNLLKQADEPDTKWIMPKPYFDRYQDSYIVDCKSEYLHVGEFQKVAN